MKDSVNNYLDKINREELANFYSNHIPKECMEKFEIPTLYLFNKVLECFNIERRTKSEIIKNMHLNMDEETKAIRAKKWSSSRLGHEVSQETRCKIRIGNLGKSKSKGRPSPIKGQTKETNEALKRLSEERTGKKRWTPESWEKRLNIMRKNGTFNVSEAENTFLNYLKTIYAADDIETQYNKDPRYPFHCDFYIKSQDLFIELNVHLTHGPKPFDPNDEECQKLLNEWIEKSKTSDLYKKCIDVWTVRDVRKLKFAKENNLNYKTIYQSEYRKYYKGKY